jgi:hypothetical protein
MRCYVYIVFRPDGSSLYVGKGSGDRWRRHDRKNRQNPHYAAVLKQAGGDLPVVIIRSGLTDDEALEIEAAFIAAIGREPHGPLVNLVDGGGGTTGWKAPPEWRARRAAASRLLHTNPEHKERLRQRMLGNTYLRGKKRPQSAIEAARLKAIGRPAPNKGKKHTPESLAKMSAASKGIKKSPQHCAAISAGLRGLKKSPEAVRKVATALTGRPLSESHRASISRGTKGKKKSPETVERMRSQMKRRWQDPAYRENMRRKLKGKPFTEKMRQAVIASNKRRARQSTHARIALE